MKSEFTSLRLRSFRSWSWEDCASTVRKLRGYLSWKWFERINILLKITRVLRSLFNFSIQSLRNGRRRSADDQRDYAGTDYPASGIELTGSSIETAYRNFTIGRTVMYRFPVVICAILRNGLIQFGRVRYRAAYFVITRTRSAINASTTRQRSSKSHAVYQFSWRCGNWEVKHFS